MRKYRFLEQYPRHMDAMRKIARKTLDYDEADEAISRAIKKILRRRSYRKIQPGKLRSFLCTAALQSRMDQNATIETREKFVSRFPDDNDVATLETEIEYEEKIIECPFCFQVNLTFTIYGDGVCNMCNTIVPSHYRTPRNTIRIDQLAVEFDFNKQIDVAKAVNQLSPKEQMVVRAIGLGNDSLESLEQFSGYERNDLWRTWGKAKAKLQELLSVYGENHRGKKHPDAFRRALEKAINTTS